MGKCLDAVCSKRCAVNPDLGDGQSTATGLCGGVDSQAKCAWNDATGTMSKLRDEKICHCGFSGRTTSSVPTWLSKPDKIGTSFRSRWDSDWTTRAQLADKNTEGYMRSYLEGSCNIQCPTSTVDYGAGQEQRVCGGHGHNILSSCGG